MKGMFLWKCAKASVLSKCKKLLVRTFILGIVLLCFNATNAQYPMPITQSGDRIPFIDQSGKVVFLLPKGHYPKPLNQLQVFDTLSALAVINYDKGSYLINAKGEKVKDFPRRKFSEFYNGIAIITVPETRVQYYGKADTENLFEGQYYKKAYPFVNAWAKVLTKDYNWQIIDTSGQIVLQFDFLPAGQKPQLLEISENNVVSMSYASLDAPKVLLHLIIKEGEQIKVNDLFPDYEVLKMSAFSEGLAALSIQKSGKHKEVVYINEAGETILQLKNITSYTAFNNGIAYLRDSANKTFFIDKKGTKTYTNKLFEYPTIVKDNKGKYGYYQTDSRVDMNTPRLACLYDANTHQKVFETKGTILKFNQDYVLVESNKNAADHWMLYDIKGQLIWETPTNERLYKNIKEALSNKKNVARFEVKKQEDLAAISHLKKLSFLSIKGDQITAIPSSISRLKKLESLHISYTRHLKNLPLSIAKIKTLKDFQLYNYQGDDLAELLNAMPQLKSVTLNNCKISRTFVKQLKKERPDLIIMWEERPTASPVFRNAN